MEEAKVKQVLSGDTLILQTPRNPARTLSLAFVGAPRLRREGDEPGAFASREFLRKLCVGKVVRFHTLYAVPTPAAREYGIVTLQSGQQLLDLAVAEGWLKLRDDAGKKQETPQAQELLDRLRTLEAAARAEQKGLWAANLPVIDNVHDLSDPKSFLETWKGKPLDAIVERVLSGDRLICRILLSPTQSVQTAILLAGIRAPATKRVNPSGNVEQPAEPFGDEAHSFVEQRLLQRGVKVRILGLSPNNVLVAEVRHPMGNIAEFELQAGLARCVDHHSTMLGADMGKLRQAEKQARDQHLGLFEQLVTRSNGASSGEIEAIVTRVLNADTLFVRNKAGAQKKINLSSVRQPKPSDPKQAVFGPDAKEFLRKRLIGKHVRVRIDGKRPATEGYEEREMATVLLGDKNVGLLLVENGYASVIRHRIDDADRSPIYDELLSAEEAAQSSGLGMWNPKPPKKPTEFVDYSASLELAKRQLGMFARQKRIPAVVDFVKSGSRFTVLVPRDNAKLTFVLSGISCPRSARGPTDKAEPFGQEAHDMANRRCMQRDVEIDVEGTDKIGGFIGTMYVNRENFAKTLVEDGLASVHAYSAEKSGNGNELFAAEQRAKEGRKGMWHDWTPEKEAEENHDHDHTTTVNGNGTEQLQTKDYRDVVISHVDPDSGRLKLQQVGTGTAALDELMSSFRSFHLSPSAKQPLSDPPKAGDYVSAKFSLDNIWYRARIRRNDREAKTSEVVYIDYGNSEILPWSSLRPLETAKYGVAKLRAQAVDAVLSFLQFPTSPEYLADSVAAIEAMVAPGSDGKQDSLVAKVDHVDQKDGTLYVTLFNPDQSQSLEQSINADVLTEGLAMVPKKLRPWERVATDLLAGLRKREEEAKKERRGMWEYGDLSLED